ncbi:hypothetical protein [Aurantiacibacter gangjinensis]|uniref:hypothetical protein n=1 Tax=Aurantiacibacter gangjinensis TaxID=502682 RepID=UPI00069A6C4F|nr:hypothetical protein [Aurantiacibacter gangjinensis]APE28053.1 hypothetical protein BMF35_a1224 [Aurantiacibacter gangjinensis]
MLQISYLDATTRDLATREGVADERLGPADARALRTLIAEAEAFECAAQFMEFRGIDPDAGDSLEVPFGLGGIAKFAPVHRRRVKDGHEPPGWDEIKRLMLKEVSG